MPKLEDPEFGAVVLRRSRRSRSIRLKLDARGVLSISLPQRAPLYMAKRLLNESRDNIRKSLRTIHQHKITYVHGDAIGKMHRLRIEQGDYMSCSYRLLGNELIVLAPINAELHVVQSVVREGIVKALGVQARVHLPRRLRLLANEHGFSYGKMRCSSAGTRWGSCSTSGTISLNIWLMQLPFELIDYVILHELCHTRQMNHGNDFWDLLGEHCPEYRELRSSLKLYHPYL
jgi:predicted metal-dependent hydrolase